MPFQSRFEANRKLNARKFEEIDDFIEILGTIVSFIRDMYDGTENFRSISSQIFNTRESNTHLSNEKL